MQLKIILDGLAGEVTDKQREILERASDKMLNLNNLVTELLDLSRIESGLVAHEKEKVDLTALLQDQVAFHTPYGEEKGISISLTTEGELPWLLANPVHLEEVFSNLITNAIKYSPSGGQIGIKAEVQNDYIHIDVEDTGYGMEEAELDKGLHPLLSGKRRKHQINSRHRSRPFHCQVNRRLHARQHQCPQQTGPKGQPSPFCSPAPEYKGPAKATEKGCITVAQGFSTKPCCLASLANIIAMPAQRK